MFLLPKQKPLKKQVIDIIAVDEKDLLQQIHGKTVQLNSGTHLLNTKNATTESYKMSFIEKLLDIISDPNIAYILLLVGMYGIMFELYNPGAVLPGIVGVISIILAFYSMHSLPVNYAGVALIIFAVILFLLEIKIVSHGLLAIGGVISLLLGSMMLIRSGSPLEIARISRGLIIAATTVSAAFFLFIVGAGIRAQRQKTTTGKEAMVGYIGEVTESLNPTGTILVQGEIWNAESLSGEIAKGEKVKVKELKNLKLYVEPIAKT